MWCSSGRWYLWVQSLLHHGFPVQQQECQIQISQNRKQSYPLEFPSLELLSGVTWEEQLPGCGSTVVSRFSPF